MTSWSSPFPSIRAVTSVAPARACGGSLGLRTESTRAQPWKPSDHLAGFFNLTYLVLVIVGVAPLLVGSAVYLWSVPDTVRLKQIADLLKWNMLVGVCAIWFGLR